MAEDLYDFSGISFDLQILKSELLNLHSAHNGNNSDEDEWYPPSPPVYDVTEKLIEINRNFLEDPTPATREPNKLRWRSGPGLVQVKWLFNDDNLFDARTTENRAIFQPDNFYSSNSTERIIVVEDLDDEKLSSSEVEDAIEELNETHATFSAEDVNRNCATSSSSSSSPSLLELDFNFSLQCDVTAAVTSKENENKKLEELNASDYSDSFEQVVSQSSESKSSHTQSSRDSVSYRSRTLQRSSREDNRTNRRCGSSDTSEIGAPVHTCMNQQKPIQKKISKSRRTMSESNLTSRKSSLQSNNDASIFSNRINAKNLHRPQYSNENSGNFKSKFAVDLRAQRPESRRITANTSASSNSSVSSQTTEETSFSSVTSSGDSGYRSRQPVMSARTKVSRDGAISQWRLRKREEKRLRERRAFLEAHMRRFSYA